jgi:arylsulfatase A-like enzyme
LISVLLLSTMIATPAAGSLAGARPNIVLVMTDDQGYGDLACHGHPFLKTPHLDALHAQSTRLTDFHVSPTCSPTRSALMSGRLPFRNGVTHTILERERMALDAVTIADILHDAGYATGIFGKWHLGDEDAYQPGVRGFSEVFIHGGGGIGQAYPGSCADAPPNAGNNKRDGYMGPVIRHNGTFVKTNGYCTDVFFDQATQWIDAQAQAQAKEPFFAYISTNAPHGPYICPASYQERYAQLAATASKAAFCGMVTNIDDNIGRLRAHLQAKGLADNTLFIFMTDNGSAGGIYNAGLKGSKGSLHEGGTRVPAFWYWPGHLEAGREIDTLTRHVDVLPTLAAIGGAEMPGELDGRSLLPLLADSSKPWPDRMTFFHGGRWGKPGMEGRWGGDGPASMRHKRFAVRNERWRLVGTGELYDVLADPQQQHNVIEDHRDVAAGLQQAYERWWDDMQPFLVNEDVPLSPTHPFHRAWAAQQGP